MYPNPPLADDDLISATFHYVRPPDNHGHQEISFLDQRGHPIALQLDMASMSLLHSTTAPGYFRHGSPGAQASRQQQHPTRHLPRCTSCAHMVVRPNSTDPLCNHPGLPVSTVDGYADTPCSAARATVNLCGRAGQLYRLAFDLQVPGLDEVEGNAQHSSRSTPLCTDCRHLTPGRWPGSETCGAPRAPRNLATGEPSVVRVLHMRSSARHANDCGPAGRWFEPAASAKTDGGTDL